MRLTMGMKKVFSLVLAGAMVLTGANVNTTKASAEETTSYAAHLTFADSSWGNGVWNAGEANDATVDVKAGSATYTVSAENKSGAAANGSVVFCVDIDGFYNAAIDAGYVIDLEDVTVKVDDTELAVDKTKVVTGDIEEKGNYRIELYNEYGSTKENGSSVDLEKLVWEKSLAVTFTIKLTEGTPAPTEEPVATPEPTPAAGEGVWSQEGSHAYISYQMAGTWDYRNTYEAGKTAKDSTSYQYIKASGEEVDYTSENIKDALLTADGEYTISLTGLDLSGSDKFNWLTIATDIERAEYPDVQVTSATVKIDGNVVEGLEGVALPYKSAADDKYYVFEIASTYTDWVLSGEATKYYRSDSLEITPEKSVEVTFTISGLGNQVPNEPIGLKAGKQFTAGNFVYQVTKQAMTRTNGAVKVVGLSKKAKKAKSLTVANTVKNSKAVYNVTAIDKKVFKGASATAVTLGKKIKSIPASAFANCKKLTTLTLKAKLKSVDKNAFKGCAKTITVKGTAKKANVKLLKKSGYKNFK